MSEALASMLSTGEGKEIEWEGLVLENSLLSFMAFFFCENETKNILGSP